MCSDYEYEDLKRKYKHSITDIVKRLGPGLCDPVAYDTAWVARVPEIDNPSLPAFPLSLQWLRDHQLDDGSWGDVKPFSPHSLTLNTLAAIIALAQWNNPEDKTRIQLGVKALWRLADHLASEVQETVGFELILPALQCEARKYGLDVPHAHYKMYELKGSKKLTLILDGVKKNGYSKAATWWYYLEILENHMQINVDGNEIGSSSTMLSKGGSILASPSATAYLLRSRRLSGSDVPHAAHYLQELYLLYQGGIPTLFPIDVFELAWSVDFFLKAGFSADDPLFKDAVTRLAEYCKIGGITGLSSHFEIPDADDTAVTLAILYKAGYQLSPKPVLNFFNGTNFVAYNNEENPSVSVNINVLGALKLFKEVKEVDEVIQKVLKWIDTSEKHVFIDDQWNISPYYSTSRAVFSLHGLRDDIVKRCIDFFMENINRDGGWGKNGVSSAEETAYVSLALTYAIECGFDIPENILETASGFLFNYDISEATSIWIGKVLYRPTLIVEAAVISAQYALAKTLELIRIKSILNEFQPYYLEANMTNIDSKKSYHVSLLYLSTEFDTNKYSDQIIRVRDRIIKRLFELNLIKKGEAVTKLLVPKTALLSLRCELSDDDMMIHAYLIMSIIFYDNIIDKNWKLFKNNTNVIKQAFQIFLEILQGIHESADTIVPVNFPNFISQCRLFFEIRGMLVKKEVNFDEFLCRQEKLFSSNIEWINYLTEGVSMSSDEFLELKKFLFSTYTLHSLNFILRDVNVFSFKNYDVFHQFEDCALKAECLVADILSFFRDIDKSNHDNYVLIKQAERDYSLKNALSSTVKLYNRQILKMYSLKKVMQSDPKYKDNQELFKAVNVVENSVQGAVDWSLATRRYRCKHTLSVFENQVTKADLSLTMKFFR